MIKKVLTIMLVVLSQSLNVTVKAESISADGNSVEELLEEACTTDMPSATESQVSPLEALTISDITTGKYSPEYVYGVNPLNDGESYSRLSTDGKRIVRHSFKTGEELEVLFDADVARGPKKLERIDGYIMSPDERTILLRTETKMVYRRTHTAVYYIYSVENKKFEPLSEGGPQMMPLFSPNGYVVAFAREGNLFLVKLLMGNAESQVTKDGEYNKIINGIPDWVNEEEFSTAHSFDFSADSEMLAWVRYDESKVPIYHISEYKGLAPELGENDAYPGMMSYKYPVAGAKNSEVSVLTYDIKSRVTREMKVPLDSDSYVPRIQFTSDASKLAIVTLNRRQNRMDIYMANPRSTECTLTLREEDAKYIPETAYGSLKFYDDHFAFISDRSGWKHLYWYTLTGQLEKQVTEGDFDVSAFYGCDVRTGTFYYASHEESPLRTAVYAVDKKGKKRKLSQDEGENSATFSKSFKYFLNVYSSASQVPVTTLNQSSDGKILATLIDNAELAASVKDVVGVKEFFTFTTSEGVELNGWMVKPRDFDASKKYAAVLYQYSGPGSQQVTDSWGLGFYPGGLYESYMAAKGILLVCVDGRGTGARGAEFEKCTYLNLGVLESKDQVEAALYLQNLPYVDPERIGIWGWSYGGFNTLMSMSEGRGVFAAGVAVAAPSNWKYYDSIYTERYMRTPGENAAGYGVNPISRASQLHGDLLLIHGTADDNVHFRNFAEVSEAYVQADKYVRQQVYTNRNHFIIGGNSRTHLFQTMTNFFLEKLGK